MGLAETLQNEPLLSSNTWQMKSPNYSGLIVQTEAFYRSLHIMSLMTWSLVQLSTDSAHNEEPHYRKHRRWAHKSERRMFIHQRNKTIVIVLHKTWYNYMYMYDGFHHVFHQFMIDEANTVELGYNELGYNETSVIMRTFKSPVFSPISYLSKFIILIRKKAWTRL